MVKCHQNAHQPKHLSHLALNFKGQQGQIKKIYQKTQSPMFLCMALHSFFFAYGIIKMPNIFFLFSVSKDRLFLSRYCYQKWQKTDKKNRHPAKKKTYCGSTKTSIKTLDFDFFSINFLFCSSDPRYCMQKVTKFQANMHPHDHMSAFFKYFFSIF